MNKLRRRIESKRTPSNIPVDCVRASGATWWCASFNFLSLFNFNPKRQFQCAAARYRLFCSLVGVKNVKTRRQLIHSYRVNYCQHESRMRAQRYVICSRLRARREMNEWIIMNAVHAMGTTKSHWWCHFYFGGRDCCDVSLSLSYIFFLNLGCGPNGVEMNLPRSFDEVICCGCRNIFLFFCFWWQVSHVRVVPRYGTIKCLCCCRIFAAESNKIIGPKLELG